MSKGDSTSKMAKKATSTSAVTKTTMDPVLASLFASSSGPVLAPVRSKREHVPVKKPEEKLVQDEADEQSSENESEATSESDSPQSEAVLQEELESRPRKRRRLSQEDDIEASYLDRLAKEEQKENSQRRKEKRRQNTEIAKENEDSDDTASSASNDLEDLSDLEPDDAVPQHESLTTSNADYDKTRRTIFLGNVSVEAIKSKSSRKQLEIQLKSVLDASEGEAIESLRFRSTAFNVAAGPKKAAYAKKDLMEETMKCTNAYAVFSTEAAARKVSKKLNGTIVLGRHLHTDWLAHPTAIDHKRCVFVGNLNFVDLESNADTNEEGEKQKSRSKAKTPADAEEGLWRAFEKCGTVENVRLIRDKTTRVGKGFAYVQFSDEIATEKALALDGKKFPPMLPRLLRVSRAKKVLKKDLKRKRDEQETSKDKRKLAGGLPQKGGVPGGSGRRKKMDGIVFEGYRASSDRGMKFKSKHKKKGGVKPTSRSSKRGAVFKASGGKKKRDMK